jgi:hypothetical protein
MKNESSERYPYLARLLQREGEIYIGYDYHLPSFIRVIRSESLVWEGKDSYPTIDDALADANEAVLKIYGDELGDEA